MPDRGAGNPRACPAWLCRPGPVLRYCAAAALAVAAQVARLPLHPSTLMPFITYVPFLVLGAWYGGFGPGLLTSCLCVFECLYYAIEPTGSFAVGDPRQWVGLAVLLLTGLVLSLLFEGVKRARLADATARELAALINQTNDSVFVWDMESARVTFWNRAAERLYGHSAHQALGQSPHGILATRFPESADACLAALRESGHWEGELVHATRDGRRVTVASRWAFRRGEDGRFRVMQVDRDISERKRLEAAQAQLAREQDERQAMLESIVQNSPACIALLRGPDFTYDTVNPAYAALTAGEPMVGRTVAEVWPDAAPLVLPLLRTVRDARKAYHAAEMLVPRRRTPDGPLEDRYFDFSYTPLPAPGGDVQVLAAAVEVTRYKKAEAELRALNQELGAIYDSAPVVLLVVDAELGVRKVNRVAARFRMASESAGLRPGDALGCLNALEDPQGCGSGPSCAECALRLAALDSLRNGTRHENVEAWLPSAGEDHVDRRCLLVSTTPLQFNGTRRVLICAHDITRRKFVEETLRQTVCELESALTQKTVLLKEVHHRVKNNLAVISSLLALKADASGIPEARLALAESQRRVHSIALIHEHLYGKDYLDRINFMEYSGQLVEELRSALVDEPERISIHMDVAPIEMGVHRAVPCALILNELVSNAFKHAFPNQRTGEIHVSMQESPSGRLNFVVEDNGIGSPPHQDSSDTRSLGLKIVKILSRQLEGSFEQEPPSAGTGTRYTVRFPAGTSRRVA